MKLVAARESGRLAFYRATDDFVGHLVHDCLTHVAGTLLVPGKPHHHDHRLNHPGFIEEGPRSGESSAGGLLFFSGMSRDRRSWMCVLRLSVALLLVCAIGADLTADTLCDAAQEMGGPISLVAAPSDASDSCGSVCVPDCFCCSISLSAQTFVLPVMVDAALPPAVRPAEPLPFATRSVSHRPPLHRG